MSINKKELHKILEDYHNKKNNMTETEALAKVLQIFKNYDDLIPLLMGVLTKQERVMLLNRLLIIKQLKAGVSHHMVSKKLKVGIATVTRGSRVLHKGKFDFM